MMRRRNNSNNANDIQTFFEISRQPRDVEIESPVVAKVSDVDCPACRRGEEAIPWKLERMNDMIDKEQGNDED